MHKILKVRNVGDYCRWVGHTDRHPLVGVIDYAEVSPVRHSLNNYSIYGIFFHDGVGVRPSVLYLLGKCCPYSAPDVTTLGCEWAQQDILNTATPVKGKDSFNWEKKDETPLLGYL